MLINRIFNGNDAVYGLTVQAVDAAIAQHGAEKAVGFPHTAYCLPCYYAVTGVKVKTLGELKEALGVVKTLMTRNHELDDALMSGVATALCAEFIEALKYLDNAVPYSEPCYGHLPDSIIRELGVPLVTGDIPGVAVILGSAPTAQEGVDLIKSYQAQGILVTLVGGIIEQAQELGLKMGNNVRIVPLGMDVTSVIHVVSVALRAALIFGNITPGGAGSLIQYTSERVPAFVNAFKPVDDVILAAGAGAIKLGFPVISNETENIAEVPGALIACPNVADFAFKPVDDVILAAGAGAIKLGFPVISNETENIAEVPGALIACPNVADFNKVSLEARNIKIKISHIDIPVAFASAFEGEIIRRKDMQVEFDGSRVDCAELVQTCDASEVEDHKITVIGPEADEMELVMLLKWRTTRLR